MLFFGIAAFYGNIGLFVIAQNLLSAFVTSARNPRKRQPLLGGYVHCTMASQLIIFPGVLGLRQPDSALEPGRLACGLRLIAAGLFISLWAHVALGRNMVGGVGLHDNHQVVITGPYAYVRHPMYSGFLVSAVGPGLIALNIWVALASLLFASAFLFRIPHEEALLEARFTGTSRRNQVSYPDYKHRTGMLIPQLRRRR